MIAVGLHSFTCFYHILFYFISFLAFSALLTICWTHLWSVYCSAESTFLVFFNLFLPHGYFLDALNVYLISFVKILFSFYYLSNFCLLKDHLQLLFRNIICSAYLISIAFLKTSMKLRFDPFHTSLT